MTGAENGIVMTPTLKSMVLLRGLQVVLEARRRSGDWQRSFSQKTLDTYSVCVLIQMVNWHGHEFYIVKVIALA